MRPHFYPASIPLSSSCVVNPGHAFTWPGWNQTKPGQRWENTMPLESGMSLLLQTHNMEVCGTTLSTEDAHMFKIYIFSMSVFVFLFVVAMFKWPHSYLHLRKRWINTVGKYLWRCRMTVGNLCCHRTVEECTVEDVCISPSGPCDNCCYSVSILIKMIVSAVWDNMSNDRDAPQRHTCDLYPEVCCVYIFVQILSFAI